MELTKIEIIFLAASALVMLLAIRRGFGRGITREIKAVVSVIIAALCLILILLLRNAVKDHTYASVIVIGGALVILAVGWKLTRLILSPLSGFKELKVVRAVDCFLGALAGAVEGGALIWAAWKILILMELIPDRNINIPWL